MIEVIERLNEDRVHLIVTIFYTIAAQERSRGSISSLQSRTLKVITPLRAL